MASTATAEARSSASPPGPLQAPRDFAKLPRESAKPVTSMTGECIGQSILGAAHQSRERRRPPVPRQLFYVVL